MGLYDSVECDYPLPDPEYQELEFQTRDFEWVMQRYAITRDGRLLKRAPRPEPGRELIALERDAELPVHGDLLIYAADPATDQGLIEYRVRFLHGRVERVQRWEGFGAERRRWSGTRSGRRDWSERCPRSAPSTVSSSGCSGVTTLLRTSTRCMLSTRRASGYETFVSSEDRCLVGRWRSYANGPWFTAAS